MYMRVPVDVAGFERNPVEFGETVRSRHVVGLPWVL